MIKNLISSSNSWTTLSTTSSCSTRRRPATPSVFWSCRAAGAKRFSKDDADLHRAERRLSSAPKVKYEPPIANLHDREAHLVRLRALARDTRPSRDTTEHRRAFQARHRGQTFLIIYEMLPEEASHKRLLPKARKQTRSRKSSREIETEVPQSKRSSSSAANAKVGGHHTATAVGA